MARPFEERLERGCPPKLRTKREAQEGLKHKSNTWFKVKTALPKRTNSHFLCGYANHPGRILLRLPPAKHPYPILRLHRRHLKSSQTTPTAQSLRKPIHCLLRSFPDNLRCCLPIQTPRPILRGLPEIRIRPRFRQEAALVNRPMVMGSNRPKSLISNPIH